MGTLTVPSHHHVVLYPELSNVAWSLKMPGATEFMSKIRNQLMIQFVCLFNLFNDFKS